MFFCPFCGTLLLVQQGDGKNKFMCSNCRYVNPIPEGVVLTIDHSFSEFSKATTDVEEEARLQLSRGLGSDDAPQSTDAEGGQMITVPCQNEAAQCDNQKAYYIQIQMRSADEPATTFFKCTKCGFQWRQD